MAVDVNAPDSVLVTAAISAVVNANNAVDCRDAILKDEMDAICVAVRCAMLVTVNADRLVAYASAAAMAISMLLVAAPTAKPPDMTKPETTPPELTTLPPLRMAPFFRLTKPPLNTVIPETVAPLLMYIRPPAETVLPLSAAPVLITNTPPESTEAPRSVPA